MTTTATADPDAPAVLRVARRWVRAVAKGDPKAICAASSGQIRRMDGRHLHRRFVALGGAEGSDRSR